MYTKNQICIHYNKYIKKSSKCTLKFSSVLFRSYQFNCSKKAVKFNIHDIESTIHSGLALHWEIIKTDKQLPHSTSSSSILVLQFWLLSLQKTCCLCSSLHLPMLVKGTTNKRTGYNQSDVHIYNKYKEIHVRSK